MNKPPDPGIDHNYMTIKVPLKKILKHYDFIQPIIEDSVLRTNKLATRVYEFIKLYCINQVENENELPEINKKFVLKIINLLGQKSNKGRKCTNIDETIISFYNDVFSLIYPDKINTIHLSYVIAQLSEEIITCFETNIKTHFIEYIYKYVNVCLKNPVIEDIKNSGNLSKDQRKKEYQKLNREIRNVKNDLINLKIEKSDEKYHLWLNEQFILFKDISKIIIKENLKTEEQKTMCYYVKVFPQQFLKVALELNKKIEELGKKPYQIFSQRNGFVPRNITLNTSGIVEVINDKKKQVYSIDYSEMLNNAKKYQNHAWKEILKLENNSVFKHKNFTFYNQISTDGISSSILFIKKEFYNKTYGTKLPKYEEVELIKNLEDLSKEECLYYKEKKLIGADPGKLDIITMIDEKGRIYSYSNCRRRYETYGRRSKEIIEKEKKQNNIISIETILSNQNKRSLKSNEFINYLIRKKELSKGLETFYEQKLFRKLAFRRFVKTKSSEDQMLNEIEKKYGSNILIGLGNWSVNVSKQMKGCMPTPNKGLVKLLKKRFDVVSIDEYKTSKIYSNDTTKELENVKVKRGRKNKSIHKLLTPTRNPNGVILNRDVNAFKKYIKYIEGIYISSRKTNMF